MKTTHLLSSILCSIFLFSSCVKDSGEVTRIIYSQEELNILQQSLDLNDEEIDYSVQLLPHLIADGATKPEINNKKAMLGRVLFYDNHLSANNSVNCSSCHLHERAFSDEVAFSEGFDGELTRRNSLALGAVVNFETSYGNPNSFFGQNAAFFWDERAHTIAEQTTLTIEDDIEMGMDMQQLPAKLRNLSYYPILFNKAFGNEDITPGRITEAVQEFVNSLASSNSKFDKARANENSMAGNFSKFTDSENRGKQLYSNQCASCHGHDLVTLGETKANNGLDLNYEDQGIYEVTGSSASKGVFKVPVLRNIELTAPYMHDGRFDTLEEVVDHYSENIQNHQNLDFRLKNDTQNGPRQMNFTDQEKQDLIAFLKTLTDQEFIADSRFSSPFK